MVLNVVLPTLAYKLLTNYADDATDNDASTLLLYAEFASSSAVSVLVIEALLYSPLRVLSGVKVFGYRKWTQRREAVKNHHQERHVKRKVKVVRFEDEHGFEIEDASRSQDEDEVDAEDDEDEWKVLAPPPPFDISRAYAESLSFFGLALLYSLVCPLVLPAAALYFFSKYCTDKYILFKQYGEAVPQPKFSRRGRAVNRFLGLLIAVAQLGPICYFCARGSTTELLLSCAMTGITVLVYLLQLLRTVVCHGRHYDPLNCRPLREGDHRRQHYTAAQLALPCTLSTPFAPPPCNIWHTLTAPQHTELLDALGWTTVNPTRLHPTGVTAEPPEPQRTQAAAVVVVAPPRALVRVDNPMEPALSFSHWEAVRTRHFPAAAARESKRQCHVAPTLESSSPRKGRCVCIGGLWILRSGCVLVVRSSQHVTWKRDRTATS